MSSNVTIETVVNDLEKVREHIHNLANEYEQGVTEVKSCLAQIILELISEREQAEEMKKEYINLVNKSNIEFEQIQELKNEYRQIVKDLIVEREYLQNLKNEYEQKVRNVRGAGRKTVINGDLVKKVSRLRQEGKTQRVIASELGVSVGTVNKVITTM